MARPWERLFIAAARLFAWCVIATPFAVVAVLIAAALAGQQQPDVVFFLGNLVVQLVATLLIAAVGAGVGASIGIGTALLTRELTSIAVSRPLGMSVNVLSAFPAVVLGWFGATLILPGVAGKGEGVVFAAASAVVVVAVIPRAYVLAARSFEALPASLREAAAAAGANTVRVAAHVTLPACGVRISGVYLDAFSRAVGEAAAVTVVFLAAANAGYPVPLFTIPSEIMTHARSMQIIAASIAQSALLILVVAAVSKTVAARQIGDLQWV